MSGPTVVDAVVLARTSEGSKAGPIGLAVILLLCIACYFLFKSMSRHMREVRENFPTGTPPPPPGPPSPTRLAQADTTRTAPDAAVSGSTRPAIEATPPPDGEAAGPTGASPHDPPG